MGAADRYIKTSRYDLAAQRHNRDLFQRWMMGRPWLAVLFGTCMAALGASAVLNWVDAPGWQRHPWEGWLLGAIAFLVAGYFLFFAVRGWREAARSKQTPPPVVPWQQSPSPVLILAHCTSRNRSIHMVNPALTYIHPVCTLAS